MRVDVSSNVSALLVAARRADQRRPGVLRNGLRRFGSRFIRVLVRRDLSGRPGLNRVTGQAARSFHRVVTGRGSELTLHAFSNAQHVAYHMDDYEPQASPRRFPPRVRAGELWEEMLEGDDLQSAFEDAIGAR